MKFISGTSHICKPDCVCVPILGWQRERWSAYWHTHENRGGLPCRIVKGMIKKANGKSRA